MSLAADEAEQYYANGDYLKACQLAVRALELDENDSEAMNLMGLCCEHGYGVEQNYKKAVEWFIKAKEKNSRKGCYNLARCYEYGNGVVRDYISAKKLYLWVIQNGEGSIVEKARAHCVECLKKAVGTGSDPARVELGKRYYFGMGVEKDVFKALRLWAEAASHGSNNARHEISSYYDSFMNAESTERFNVGTPDMQNFLGDCCRLGYFIDDRGHPYGRLDDDGMIKMYLKAAEQGHAQAQCNLGSVYYTGIRRIKQDYGEAVKWFTLSAEQGNAEAQCGLGDCYFNGFGVERDYKKAVNLYEKAALQGNAKGQYLLGECYNGGNGVEKDGKKAFELFTKSAEQGCAAAMYALGALYETGSETACDGEKAFELYLRAAELGNEAARQKVMEIYRKSAESGEADAACKLADIYYKGNWVEQDYESAAKLYAQAAETGSAYVVNALGECYLYRRGVERDREKALELFGKAADLGCAEALKNIGDMYYNGLGVERDFGKAVEYFNKAIEGGSLSARVGLGDCYRCGNGVEQDGEKAWELYHQAADLPEAQYAIGKCYDKDIAVYPDGYEVRIYGDCGKVYGNSDEAICWYRKAAAQNHTEAMKALGALYEKKNDKLLASHWYGCAGCDYMASYLWDEMIRGYRG